MGAMNRSRLPEWIPEKKPSRQRPRPPYQRAHWLTRGPVGGLCSLAGA